MAESRKKKSKEIPLKFGNNIRYIKGVTKYTTCTDVIKMVLRKMDDGKENGGPEAFGIYESSRGIERLLPGKSRLLKVVRSWGMDNNYEFVFRKVNPGFSLPKLSESKRRKLITRRRDLISKPCASTQRCSSSKYSHPNEFVKELYFNEDSDSSMEEFMSNVHQENMEGILNFCGNVANSQFNKLSSVSTQDISRNVTGQSDDNNMVYTQGIASRTDVNDVKYAVRKTLKPKTCTVSSSKSKTETVLPRNSYRTVHESTPCRRHSKEAHRAVKRHEKLAENIVNKVGRLNQKEGKEAILKKYFADYITYRSPAHKYRDSRFRERGDGAESGDESQVSRRGVGSGYNHVTQTKRTETVTSSLCLDDTDSGHEDDSTNFDNAFIGDAQTEIDNEIDTAENDSAVLNSTGIEHCEVVGRLVDYSLSENDSILSDPSDISTVSEHVHNVSSVSDVVKAVFNENKTGSEDDEMESFMKTKLYEDLSDEGLSSLGSDDEKEILV